jgi:hypothetical protein
MLSPTTATFAPGWRARAASMAVSISFRITAWLGQIIQPGERPKPR